MDVLHKQGLYDPANEHDACGVGFVAHIKGQKSHAIVVQGLEILKNLDHRGAVGADPLQGDGAGVLIQIPDALYRAEMAAQGVELPPPGEYGVGMLFMPKEHASRLACENEIERAVRGEGQVVLGWRDVPVSRDMPMSPTVRATEPVIRQVFVGRGPDVMVPEALERKLYVIRRVGANAVVTKDVPEGAVMVGIPARSTLLDATEYAREFVPYGTPCSETFDPATQKVELLQCQLEQMQKQLKALLDERELAAVDDEAPRRKGSRTGA